MWIFPANFVDVCLFRHSEVHRMFRLLSMIRMVIFNRLGFHTTIWIFLMRPQTDGRVVLYSTGSTRLGSLETVTSSFGRDEHKGFKERPTQEVSLPRKIKSRELWTNKYKCIGDTVVSNKVVYVEKVFRLDRSPWLLDVSNSYKVSYTISECFLVTFLYSLRRREVRPVFEGFPDETSFFGRDLTH